MTIAYDPTLLPAGTERERCAPHAERIALDPGGTALWVDELIVVDVPLPWPKPVWAADGFTAVPELVMAAGEAGRRVRVLAAVPLDDGVARVVTHRLDQRAQFARTEHHVRPESVRPESVRPESVRPESVRPENVGPDSVAGLLERLLADGLDAGADSVVSTEPVREFLICTQGSHDVCCGSRGTAMHAELIALDPTMSIRRVSHTGGHRMAPTGMTLPDGRMWGMVELDEIRGILRREIGPAAVAQRCRGWIGLAAGPEQVAERAVMAEIDDWAFDSTPRTASARSDGATTVVEVRTDHGTWTVEVERGRAIPTIACGAPGGLPAKPGAEWRVRSIHCR